MSKSIKIIIATIGALMTDFIVQILISIKESGYSCSPGDYKLCKLGDEVVMMGLILGINWILIGYIMNLLVPDFSWKILRALFIGLTSFVISVGCSSLLIHLFSFLIK